MPKIKHTKNELRDQRDALRRFERYLPTLQLKKKQLHAEVRNLETVLHAKKREEERLWESLEPWVRLFSEPFDFGGYLRLETVETDTSNVAGVEIPVLKRLTFEKRWPDFFATPTWVDDGIRALESLITLRVELSILQVQHRLLSHELRIATQRVNLFEKVKIPEARDNIRVIRIFLGDQQTAEVARAKIAKSKGVVKTESA